MIVTLILLVLVGALAEDPLVKSPAGIFKGAKKISLGGREFAAFSGIPYAKPPVGNLRFKLAEKLDPFEEEYNATKEGDDCIQKDDDYNQYPKDPKNPYVGSEDCLYLNVYTPLKGLSNSKDSWPVMVFIHGGGYWAGSGSEQILGPEILMDRDIVLITMNYRLWVFGFLAVNDSVPANLGLKDQKMALEWVQENVKAFGGNPDSVTLFGESAGGSAVYQHMVSPLSKGLFHRAISQSGSADSDWATTTEENQIGYANEFLEAINCTGDNLDVLECLQNRSTEEICKAAELESNFINLEFRPVFEEESEGAFLTQQYLDEGSNMTLFSGVTDSEGLLYLTLMAKNDPQLTDFNEGFRDTVIAILSITNRTDNDAIVEKIKQFYIGESEFSMEKASQIVKIMSDYWFVYPLYKTSMKHQGTQFIYMFSHPKGEKKFEHTVCTTCPLDLEGTGHGDDLLYLFTMKKFFPDIKFNEEDAKMSKIMVDLWTSFAKDGVPTTDELVSWPESKDWNKYGLISSKGVEIKEKMFERRMQFWNEIEQIISTPESSNDDDSS